MSTSYDRQQPRFSWIAHLLPLLLILVLGGFLLWRFWPHQSTTGVDPNAAARAVTPRGDLAEDEKTTIAIFKSNSPCVVHITSVSLGRDFFTRDLFQIPRGVGTG